MHSVVRGLFKSVVPTDAESSSDDLLWCDNRLELSNSGNGHWKRLFPLDADVVFLASYVVQYSSELG